MLSWKASIFSCSELLVQAPSIPGCQSLSSFGSMARQFSFTSWLEATEAPLALHTASKQEREGGRDKERDRGSEKQSFMQKQPLESFMATHGPLSFYSFPSTPPSLSSVCFIFWCVFFPAVKYLSLYNLQERVAPSAGDVERKMGEICAREVVQCDLWCFLSGRKQSIAGIIAKIPKTTMFWAASPS